MMILNKANKNLKGSLIIINLRKFLNEKIKIIDINIVTILLFFF